ncbi:hypothetical protein ACIBO9_09665 [Streptomyces prunicolor]|uniref:hypothetical protein n=1 Tax=Streptomyces prunicolor TaxID=67348 RepID=UPI0037D6DF5A
MPAPAQSTRSLFSSVLDLLDVFDRPAACPGCGAHAPAWTRVAVDGLSVLTHDGDVICSNDKYFGASTRPAPVLAPVSVLGVAA